VFCQVGCLGREPFGPILRFMTISEQFPHIKSNIGLSRVNPKICEKKRFFSTGRTGCGLLRVARGGSGASPPAARSVAGYTGLHLFFFEQTHNYLVYNQRLLPWQLRCLSKSKVRLASLVRCDPDSNRQVSRTFYTFNQLNHKRPCHM